MSRLTKKFNGEYYSKDANTIMFNSETDYNAIQKLGKLEDIEEELGCPLEVVFKVLLKNEGIRTIKNDTYYIHNIVRLSTGNLAFELESAHYLYLKDYQKTWWLKGEK